MTRPDLAGSREGTARERLTAAAVRAQGVQHLGAFLDIADPAALPAEQLTDGLLAGVPIAVKANIDTRDLPTSAGTPALRDSRPGRDHPVLARLRAAGATVVGTTNLHELAFGITSNNAAFGPVRNPHDPSRSAGGSSGGSAVAVATWVVPIALGTDTGGSIRIPAAHCGIVGFRPTVGRWGTGRVVPLSATRDTVGVLATTTADVVLVDEVVTGQPAAPVPTARGLRLGIPRPGFFDGLHAEVADRVGEALDRLADAGVVLVETDLVAGHELDARCGFPIVFAEVVRDLPRYLADLPGGPTFEELIAGVVSPDVRAALEHAVGDPIPAADYRESMALREQLRAAYAAVLRPDGDSLDALIYPTVPLPAPPLGDDVSTELCGESVPTFPTTVQNTAPGSTSGMPSISLPCGSTAAGLPVGLSLEALPGDDVALLAAARRVEQLLTS